MIINQKSQLNPAVACCFLMISLITAPCKNILVHNYVPVTSIPYKVKFGAPVMLGNTPALYHINSERSLLKRLYMQLRKLDTCNNPGLMKRTSCGTSLERQVTVLHSIVVSFSVKICLLCACRGRNNVQSLSGHYVLALLILSGHLPKMSGHVCHSNYGFIETLQQQ